MTPQQIKANAPEGATYYNPDGVKAIYYKMYKGSLKFYCKKHGLWYGSCLSLDKLKPL